MDGLGGPLWRTGGLFPGAGGGGGGGGEGGDGWGGVERLAEIIAQRREMETDIPFLYQAGEKEAGIPDQRIREILDAALCDYADRMQGEELYDFLGGTLGMTDEEIKAFGFCFTEEEMGRESEEQ